jgi:hypothetical protein
MNTPTNTDDLIDSREVIEAIENLRGCCIGADEAAEFKALLELQEEAEGYANGGWHHGATLIADHYFKTYAQELAEDCGYMPEWPLHCIDWERAARELKFDYSSVEFDGETYWIR